MASRGVNKVILLGTLGQDPEVRYTANGSAIANLSLATSETWRDKNTGEQKEKTEWHRVVLFGKTAEIAGEYLRKGRQVYIEGSLQTRKWQDQSGQDRYTTEVAVQPFSGQMQLIGGAQQNQGGQQQQGGWGQPNQPAAQQGFAPQQQMGGQPQQGFQPQQKAPQQQAAPAPMPSQEPSMDFDDDIPF